MLCFGTKAGKASTNARGAAPGNFCSGVGERRVNSHRHRRERGESLTLGRAMKCSADTTNTPLTRVVEVVLKRYLRGTVGLRETQPLSLEVLEVLQATSAKGRQPCRQLIMKTTCAAACPGRGDPVTDASRCELHFSTPGPRELTYFGDGSPGLALYVPGAQSDTELLFFLRGAEKEGIPEPGCGAQMGQWSRLEPDYYRPETCFTNRS